MTQPAVKASSHGGVSGKTTEGKPYLGISFALGFCLVLVAALAWNSYSSYRASSVMSERVLELQELRGIILHSDEIVSMSAAMTAMTRDPHWEQRYEAQLPVLRERLEKARTLLAELDPDRGMGVADRASISLGRFQSRALERLAAGSGDDVAPVFPGESYGTLKRLYGEGMHEITERLQIVSTQLLKGEGAHSAQQSLLLGCLLLVLLGVGMTTFQMLRRSDAMLKQQAQELASLHRSRGHFLSRMSHAIRSPMTSVLGYTDLLLDTQTSDAERSEYLHVIRRNGEDVLTTLGDLVDLFRLQSGNIALERIEISPFEIIHEVASYTRDDALERSLGFDVEYEGKVPEKIVTDVERVRQVLVTLVSNAIQFTSSGRIHIVTKLTDAEASGQRLLQFNVVDSGVGMNPEQSETVFDAFSSSGHGESRATGGTGLGLAISRQLACLLGGDLKVESTMGSGSCFSLTIDPGPLNNVKLVEKRTSSSRSLPATPEEEPVPVTNLSGRVLVAEDTADVRHWLCGILRKTGLGVEAAENGEAAYDMALAARELGQEFNVILMDMQMPVLSGYEATRKLRERGYQGIIIALTSHAMEGDREECIRAGCDSYAVKPIDRVELVTRLASYLKLPEPEV